MPITLPLAEMTTEDKLRAMRDLWTSLTSDEATFPLPAWHQAELRETEIRMASGEEEFIDWEVAKKSLLRKSNVRIVISRTADNDLLAGFRYYKKKGVEVGQYFLDSLISDIDSLVLYAGIHRRVDGFYVMLSRRFAFAIYYKI